MEKHINAELVRIITLTKLKNTLIGYTVYMMSDFFFGNGVMIIGLTIGEKYTEEEMLRKVEEGTFIFKDGILYLKPHIVLKFSENQSVIAYFNSNEEMESWARAFIDFSKKPFVYLK